MMINTDADIKHFLISDREHRTILIKFLTIVQL